MPGRAGGARLGDREAALYLAYDTLQLGDAALSHRRAAKPFAMLMLAPVTVLGDHPVAAQRDRPVGAHRGGDQPARRCSTCRCRGATDAAVAAAALRARRLDGAGVCHRVHRRLHLDRRRGGAAHARRLCRDATGAWRANSASRRSARSPPPRRIKLGSPLATIAVVAKELVRDLPPDSPYAEDAQLLLSQSERCRTILADLAHQRDGERASPSPRLPFSALVEAAGEPYRAAPASRELRHARRTRPRRQPVRRSRWCRAARRSCTGSATSSRTRPNSPAARSP